MYEFKKIKDPENRFDTTEVSIKSEAYTLPGLLEDFQDFLRGCGFTFNGSVEIVEEDVSAPE